MSASPENHHPWQETAPERLVLREPTLFTDRKAEILQLILDGYGKKHICEVLGITTNTLRNHLYGIDTSYVLNRSRVQTKTEGRNTTAMGIFGIVELLGSCRPENTPALIATLINSGVVAVE